MARRVRLKGMPVTDRQRAAAVADVSNDRIEAILTDSRLGFTNSAVVAARIQSAVGLDCSRYSARNVDSGTSPVGVRRAQKSQPLAGPALTAIAALEGFSNS